MKENKGDDSDIFAGVYRGSNKKKEVSVVKDLGNYYMHLYYMYKCRRTGTIGMSEALMDQNFGLLYNGMKESYETQICFPTFNSSEMKLY
ncbi:hypothetical protein RIR_jg5941.t1 [Rhizophagus irregularis DAOM 181602=DAOM 197198]|nr:hypothetical protein RIR_jg5941.t1 [Rhizophagus irregularis DAOM 181602=DAOM 197198]